MPRRISKATWGKLVRTRTLILKLPLLERRAYLAQIERAMPAGSLIVIGSEMPVIASPIPPALPATADADWDLKFANWLDGVYTVVADRVEVVGKKAGDVASSAGFSLWPLVIAGIGIVWIMSNRKRAVAGE
jgi:hypothetical protein